MEELLNRKEYTRVVEEIRLQLRFAVKDPEIQRILAIARYWMWKDDNTNESLLNEAVTTLAVAHAAFPNDAEMLWKYLDVCIHRDASLLSMHILHGDFLGIGIDSTARWQI